MLGMYDEWTSAGRCLILLYTFLAVDATLCVFVCYLD